MSYFSKTWCALVLAMVLLMASPLVSTACTVSNVTISYFGDNYITGYLNGNQLNAELNGITTVNAVNPLTVPSAWILPNPQINILSWQVEDSANHAPGNFAGVTYDMTITYSD